MKVLYLAEDYLSSKVHHNLCSRLADYGFDVTVYTIGRSENLNFSIESTYTDINYKVVYNKFSGNSLRYKVDFRYKLLSKYFYLKNKIDLAQINVVIAATLFSEGVVANQIFKEYGVPFIVACRGTDLNLYIKKMVHLWHIGKQIVDNSSKVVFLTQNLKNRFFSSVFYHVMKFTIDDKNCVIPNAVDDIWLNNIRLTRNVDLSNKILYIGRFDRNKNVLRLQKAILDLSKKHSALHLTLIGGGGKYHEDVLKNCEKYPEYFSYLGKIYEKNKLMDIVRMHGTFAMVSHSETFGLVYVEALSQGLSVLYTKGQGIDGTFRNTIGESAVSSSTKSIRESLDRLISNWYDYELLTKDEIEIFSWDSISKRYKSLIDSILFD